MPDRHQAILSLRRFHAGLLHCPDCGVLSAKNALTVPWSRLESVRQLERQFFTCARSVFIYTKIAQCFSSLSMSARLSYVQKGMKWQVASAGSCPALLQRPSVFASFSSVPSVECVFNLEWGYWEHKRVAKRTGHTVEGDVTFEWGFNCHCWNFHVYQLGFPWLDS